MGFGASDAGKRPIVQALDCPLAMMLSAIVPTHERPIALQRCLETLAVQEVDPERFEVIVVDDGSETDIEAVVADVSRESVILIRYVRQALSGLNAARNRGAALACGEALGFLDDDTLVSPGWARAMLSAFLEHPCAAVGGRVELQLAAPPPSWLAERRYFLAEYDLGPLAHWLEGDPVPVGANCAVRRSDYTRLGGFREGLDRLAGSLVSNGDTEFFRRLRASGGRMRYEPAATVLHCVPADRLTIEFFTRRHFAQGLSDQLMFALEAGDPRWRQQRRLLQDFSCQLLPMANTVARDVARGRGLVNARFFASYWRGRIRGVSYGPTVAPAPTMPYARS
jgi:GT2 family glycosyltransferase